jgi:hypothetical protein
MTIKEMVPKPANPKFNAAAKSHRLCLDQLIDADRQLVEYEKRLAVCLQESEERRMRIEEFKQTLEVQKSESKKAQDVLHDRIKKLEEDVKHERRRASQALDVAESTSDAAGGIGRLLRTLVDDNVLEQLRLANAEREQRAREEVRHRRSV